MTLTMISFRLLSNKNIHFEMKACDLIHIDIYIFISMIGHMKHKDITQNNQLFFKDKKIEGQGFITKLD